MYLSSCFYSILLHFCQSLFCVCIPHRLISSLQVKKTTQLWFGSGFIRARPSAAHPVAPTTNWCPMSSPINLYIPLLLKMCITQLWLCTVLASLKYSSYLQNEVTKHQTATFSFFNLQDVNLSWTILVPSTSWSEVMSPCLIGFHLFCYSTWSTCWPHQSLLYMLPFTEGSHVVRDTTVSFISIQLQFTFTHVLYNVTLAPLTPFIEPIKFMNSQLWKCFTLWTF